MKKQTKNKPEENKGIWASLYEKMRNHDEPFIPAPSATTAPLSSKQFAEKIEIGMKRLFDTATKK